MSRARDLSNFVNPAAISVDGSFNVGINSQTPDAKLDVVGVVSATSFTGDGANISNVSASSATTAEGLTGTPDIDVRNVTGTAGTFSGPFNIDDTTESSSTSTGALIVDGGVGIAKSLFVGGDVSIAGTVTYEDVTNVDSIGVITARSGVHFGATGAGTLVEGNATGIGIGTDNPQAKLHVEGTNGTMRLTDTNGSPNFKFFNGGTNSGDDGVSVISFNNTGFAGTASIQTRTASNGSNLEMIFSTGQATEAMRIDENGRLGIGTNNPINDLHINNDATGVGPIIQLTNDTGDCRLFFGQNTTVGSANAQGQFRYNVANNYMAMYTAGGERMRIDSSGKVGIGTAIPSVGLQVQDNSSFSLIRVVASSGSVAGIDFGDAADTDTAGVRYDNVTDSMAFRVNAQERARIDSSGRVLIGTTTEGYAGAETLTVANSGNAGITIRSGTSGNGTIAFSDATSGDAEYDGYIQYRQGTQDLVLATDSTERMRIDSSGNLYIGSSTYYGTANYTQTSGLGNWLFRQDDASSVGGSVIHTNRKGGFAGYYFNLFDWVTGEDLRWFDFYKNGATFSRLQLTSNGNNIELTNQSDYRLKQDVSDYTGALEIVKQLKPKTYNWISNPEHPYKDTGFIAHELQEVLPDLVSGEKDEMGYPENLSEEDGPVTSNTLQPVYQSLDMTRLIPTLTAALKEAIAKIETLEQRLSDAGIA